MRIVIVGAGGIGLLFGWHLGRSGHEVIFVETDGTIVEAVNRDGVGLIGQDEIGASNFEFVPAKALQEAHEVDFCDVVFLSVKSFDTQAAIQSVAHLITKKSPVISLQTGLGNVEKMEKVERRNNIIGGFTYMAAASMGPGRVRLGGAGQTFLGELDGSKSARCEKISSLLAGSGLEAATVTDIVPKLWRKVLVYSAINPLSAILRIKNGHLLEKMESIDLAKRLIDEGVNIAEACGVLLDRHEIYELFFDTCKRTSGNISSMLLDLIMGRRTEVEALNGELARLALQKRITSVTHQTMVELVKLAEKWGAGFEPKV